MDVRVCHGAHRGRDTGHQLRRRSRDESGSILVLTAVILPLFLLCCAIVVDVGYWWVNGKKAQIAADSCALAAAQHLKQNYNLDHCRFGSPAQDYVLINIPQNPTPEVGTVGTRHISTRVTSPYTPSNGPGSLPDDTLVEAVVKLRVRTFFGAVVGLDWIDLTRRAVAEKLTGDGNYAIYSHDDGCPQAGTGESLEFNGENHWINGRVHSNGQYQINNSDSDPPYEPFWAAHGTRVDCGASVNPHGSARFGGDGYSDPDAETLPWDLPATETWPTWYTPADFGWLSGCDVNGEEITIKESGGNTLVEVKGPPGPDQNIIHSGTSLDTAATYCASKVFKINRQDLTGTLTALSPEINVDQNNIELTPNEHNVLFFTVPNNNLITTDDGSFAAGGNPSCQPKPSKEMVLNGNSHTWTGIIFNPCGRVLVNVGGSTIGTPALAGTILGLQVKINGKQFHMIGTGNFGGNINTALVE